MLGLDPPLPPMTPAVSVATPAVGHVETGRLFAPVNVDRASQLIVDQIKTLIRNGHLSPGERLPSERSLSGQFEVSRVTVREALRMLETSGLIAVRVGAHGGAFVTEPTTESISEGLADLLSLSPLTALHVTEARSIIELGTLPLVIKRATATDIQELLKLTRAGCDAVAAGTYTMEDSAAFHIRLAECAHNPAIEMLVQTFRGPLLMSLREAQLAAPIMGPHGAKEHQQIARAVSNGDLAAAQHIMRDHLERTTNRLLHPAPQAIKTR